LENRVVDFFLVEKISKSIPPAFMPGDRNECIFMRASALFQSQMFLK
jgi:hypothetical protein